MRLPPPADRVEAFGDQRRLGGLQPEAPRGHNARGSRHVRHLEGRLSIAEPERGGADDGLRPIGLDDRRFDQAGGDVRLMGAGIGPDGAAHGTRDGQPELQAGEAGLARDGRRLGHRQAGVGDQILALDADPLGADQDDQAADAGVADDQVGAPTEQEDGHLTCSREADQAAQLEQVVDGREKIRRAADQHGGESGERFAA
jgi:hypothetical protein